MKRKMKLISSIFSLALAFTFMSYGVFAAAQRTVNVNGSLRFEATGIDGVVVVDHVLPTSTASSTTWVTTGITNSTVTYTSGSSTNPTGHLTTIGTQDYTETNVYYRVRIRITNNGERAMAISLTAPAKLNSVPASVVEVTAEAGNSGSSIAAGATGTYIYNFTLINKKAANFNATEGGYSFTFVLTRG